MTYPDGIDALVNVNANDTLAGGGHAARHNSVNTALGEVKDFLGTGTGYRYNSTVYFTSNGTFTKATYPWLRAIRVKVQGAGGGGGGAATTGAGALSNSRGGSGGVYAESFITDIAGLSASVTVTVGSGGAGGAAGNNAGSAGGNSSFGTAVVGTGGSQGGSGDFGGSLIWNAGVTDPVTSGTGDFVIPGRKNDAGFSLSFTAVIGSTGGDSVFGTGGRRNLTFASGQGGNGYAGSGYGAGGSGGLNSESTGTARSGGAGSQGIVIVELFA